MARLPRVRFSVIEIPADAEPSSRPFPQLPREVPPSEDPLLARLLIQCARRAIQSGSHGEDEEGGDSRPNESANLARRGGRRPPVELRDEAPPPLGETLPSLTQHQPWPRRDDAPHHPR